MTRLSLSMVFAGAVSLGGAVFVPDCAAARSCVFPADSSPRELAKESFSDADAVFAEEVIELDEPLAGMRSTALTTFTFRVSEVWKGSTQRIMDVQTEDWAAGCGYRFEEGESYLVYTYDGMRVTGCGGAKPLSKAGTDLEVLGAESTPKGQTGASGERLPETSGAPLGLLLPVAAVLSGGFATAVLVKPLSGGRYGG
ncbi:MAG: hypothetical protein M3P70_18425 [Actinomycetota bacterium]|nr:hypothetical protein [Actinomycetota bacterium]